MAQQILHKRSPVLDKKPTAEQIGVGEICINYASGDGCSFLTFKKEDDSIATLHEDDYFMNIINDNINDINSKITEIENTLSGISAILEDVLYNV